MNLESDVEGGEVGDYDGELREYGWSVNLELEGHADDRDLIVREAKRAVDQTASGYFVNLVTHENHGHPEEYLHDALREEYGDGVSFEYVDQCGCGGHVTRVHVA